MTAKLVAEEGKQQGLVLTFDGSGDEWVIGRDPDVSQLVIEDPSVSRKHLLCRQTPDGMVIENLSSTNPALINDKELKGKQPLHDGDLIVLGSGKFRYHTDPGEPSLAGVVNNAKVKKQEEGQMEPREDTIFDENAPAGKDALAEINFELVDTGRWLLKVIGGPNNGAEYSMQASNSYVIGTDPNSCDIVFHDTSVSRQHARITVTDEDALYIEDLKSRNGTLLDGEPLKTRKQLNPNTLVTMGTTSFIVFDREGEMQTIISPLLPSIVKVLQKEEPKKSEEDRAALEAKRIAEEKPRMEAAAALAHERKAHHMGALIVISIIGGLMAIIGLGTFSLFQGQPVVNEHPVDTDKMLAEALAPFPSVKPTFIKATGRLALVGHVLTATDKNQLLYNLQGLKFIKSVDDSGVIIDEFVWQEINQLLSNNPNWKGITVQATAPGHFVLTGYLQTRKQAESLLQYISENFRYLDLLDKKIVVEEDVIGSVTSSLQNIGIKNLSVQMSNGELAISGNIPNNRLTDYEALINEFKSIPGVRMVKNFVTELPPEATMINISDKYTVTGYSNLGADNISVVINGRILSKGDSLDGMTITNIQPNGIMLEKDNVKYRIDYNR